MRHIYYKYWHQCSKSLNIGINADGTGRDGTTSKHRATQLLICELLSFAIFTEMLNLKYDTLKARSTSMKYCRQIIDSM